MELNDLLKDTTISLTTHQLDQFDQYAKLLVEWNEKFNLTSITDREEIYVKHFYDSLLLASNYDLIGSLCDVGSGAGFPAIPLKIYLPELEVSIIEPTNKKCTFITEVANQLGLEGIHIYNTRSEDFAKEDIKFDFVVARAVAPLNILDELCLPLVKVNGHFIAMKGPKASEELQQANKGIKILGGKVNEVKTLSLPNEQTRVFVDIIKEKETPNNYPRNYSQIKKKPL